MKILFKNGMVALPSGTRQASVLVEGDKILQIDPQVDQATVDEVVDCQEKVLIPGAIDDQVHFREPGLTHKEDLEHASRACAKGGITSFLEMPNTVPNTTTQSALESKLQLASEKSRVNFGFYIGATPDNVDELKQAHRTPGIKIFIGSSTGNLLVDEQAALERIFAETNLPICAHCEDESTVQANAQRHAGSTNISTHSLIRNHEAAVIATRRAIDLAHRHNHHFHVLHVSTADEIPLIVDGGDLISSEVCPHHLFFNVEDYPRLGSLVKMNPSIKNKVDNEALWQALLDNKIDVIATDHAPHTLKEKREPYPACPSGLPAVENSLALMLNQVSMKKCTLDQVVKWMCTRPAEIWHMKRKGKIEVGYDADLTLVDMNLTLEIKNEDQQTKCGWSPWHGTSLTGWPIATWVLGQKVFERSNGNVIFNNDIRGKEVEYHAPC